MQGGYTGWKQVRLHFREALRLDPCNEDYRQRLLRGVLLPLKAGLILLFIGCFLLVCFLVVAASYTLSDFPMRSHAHLSRDARGVAWLSWLLAPFPLLAGALGKPPYLAHLLLCLTRQGRDLLTPTEQAKARRASVESAACVLISCWLGWLVWASPDLPAGVLVGLIAALLGLTAVAVLLDRKGPYNK
jgi:hypothetical protein